MMNRVMNGCAAAIAAVGAVGTAAGTANAQLDTEVVVSGLDRPVFVTHAPGDASRIFVIEQRDGSTGRVRIVDLATDTLLPTPFLSVTGVSTDSEQGLLGLAFAPDYAESGEFYFYYTDSADRSRVERATVSAANPNVADASSRHGVLTVSQPRSNHNGGWLGFGPDGMLYVALGDGGGGYDPFNTGQDLSTLLAKMLRLDVSGTGVRTYTVPADNPFVGVAGARPETWHWGLRNPWRNAFDPVTGDLYIADVGQERREEVNVSPGGSSGGENFGWSLREGFIQTPFVGGPQPTGGVDPALDYDRSGGRCSITGGIVYRGAELAAPVRGRYFYGDYCTGEIRSGRFNPATGLIEDQIDHRGEIGRPRFSLVSFGEDAMGEMYICDLSGGTVSRVVRGFADCDQSGFDDVDEVRAGSAADINGNEQPDSCECLADLNGDQVHDLLDAFLFLDVYEPSDPSPVADIDGDGDNDIIDAFGFLDNYPVCLEG